MADTPRIGTISIRILKIDPAIPWPKPLADHPSALAVGKVLHVPYDPLIARLLEAGCIEELPR